jgi:putative N6-adenine-specific DNA methylase
MKPYRIFAVVQPGLEEIAEQEINALGYRDLVRIKGGFFLNGHLSTVIKLNLACRCLSRVLIEIAEFEAKSFSHLEKQFGQINWQDYLEKQNVCIHVSSYQSALYHEKAIAERLIDSLADILGRQITVVGSPDEEQTQLISIYAKHDKFTVRMDTTGVHLHKRGYGTRKEDAPLRETLACAMLYAIGWKESELELCDPMCGSWTIPIEAALMAKGTLWSEFRNFSFQEWKFYQPEVFDKIRNDLIKKTGYRPAPVKLVSPLVKITGSDLDEKALHSAQANADQAGVAYLIDFSVADLHEIKVDRKAVVVTNPPWGKRLEDDKIKAVWRDLHNLSTRGQKVYLLLPEIQSGGFTYPHKTLLRFEAGGIKVKFIKLEA